MSEVKYISELKELLNEVLFASDTVHGDNLLLMKSTNRQTLITNYINRLASFEQQITDELLKFDKIEDRIQILEKTSQLLDQFTDFLVKDYTLLSIRKPINPGTFIGSEREVLQFNELYKNNRVSSLIYYTPLEDLRKQLHFKKDILQSAVTLKKDLNNIPFDISMEFSQQDWVGKDAFLDSFSMYNHYMGTSEINAITRQTFFHTPIGRESTQQYYIRGINAFIDNQLIENGKIKKGTFSPNDIHKYIHLDSRHILPLQRSVFHAMSAGIGNLERSEHPYLQKLAVDNHEHIERLKTILIRTPNATSGLTEKMYDQTGWFEASPDKHQITPDDFIDGFQNIRRIGNTNIKKALQNALKIVGKVLNKVFIPLDWIDSAVILAWVSYEAAKALGLATEPQITSERYQRQISQLQFDHTMISNQPKYYAVKNDLLQSIDAKLEIAKIDTNTAKFSVSSDTAFQDTQKITSLTNEIQTIIRNGESGGDSWISDEEWFGNTMGQRIKMKQNEIAFNTLNIAKYHAAKNYHELITQTIPGLEKNILSLRKQNS